MGCQISKPCLGIVSAYRWDSMQRLARADNLPVTHPRIPLIRLDAGWLFIIAGLVTCIGCVLVSADTELQMLRVQQSLLHAQEQTAFARIRVHEDFLDRLENPDDSLTRRLAATELNLMPTEDEPVLRLVSYELPTIEWIDRQVERETPKAVLANTSLLTRLATGPYRLWLFGGGVMCVFIGLLLDPSASRVRRRIVVTTTPGAIEMDGDSNATVDTSATQFEADSTSTTATSVLECEEDESVAECDDEFVDEVEEEDDDAEVEDVCDVDDEDEEVDVEDDADLDEEECEVEDEVDVEELEDEECEEAELLDEDAELIEGIEALDDEGEEELDNEEEPQPSVEVRSIAAPAEGVISIRPPMSVAPPAVEDDELERRVLAEPKIEMLADEEAQFSDEFDAVDELPVEDWDADVPPEDVVDEALGESSKSRKRSPRKR